MAAAELILISLLLRLGNTVAFYPAAIACSLCSVQLGILLINRFSQNTRNVRKIARTAEFSSQAAFITDPVGRIKWTNPRFTRLTGYPLSDIVGRTFSMVLHGQDTDTHAVEKIRERIRQELPFESEILQYNSIGMSLWVSTKGQPIYDARGQVTHYLVTQLDVTEDRRQSQIIVDALSKNLGTDVVDPMTSQRVAELTYKLQSLSGTDERDQLEAAVQNLKNGFDQFAEYGPASTQIPMTQTSDNGVQPSQQNDA